jgi:hypothetical protein
LKKNLCLISSLILLLLSCRNLKTDWMSVNCQYCPPVGYRYLFAGPDKESVGGLEDNNEGYVDFIGMPAGISMYTSLKDLQQLPYIDVPAFRNVMIALGLNLQDELREINAGSYDKEIRQMGKWIKASGRPVFLNIGYDFDSKGNHYEPSEYRAAFIRITNILREGDVRNFRTLWQSSGRSRPGEPLTSWYPGDEYVDWMGYSYDHRERDEEASVGLSRNEPGTEMRRLASERSIPVFIWDASPRGYDAMKDESQEVWDSWYKPFFQHIEDYADLIKAVSYSNKLTEGNDARIQAYPLIRKRWTREIRKPAWVHRTILEENKEFKPQELK